MSENPPVNEEEVKRLLRLRESLLWTPLEGPQLAAYTSKADILLYGGAAGGGKTDLAIGLALTQHRRTRIFRREGTQLEGVIDRMEELIGNRNGYSGQSRIWRLDPRRVEFGACPNPGDEKKYQGRPADLIVFDETANFLESQVRFLMGWNRTHVPEQRCRVLMCSNPPTDASGQWLTAFFAPWLDKNYPNPAAPGELRWFATVEGKDVEVEDPIPFMHGDELITPKSRTFIPSRVTDNPYLMATGYMSTLQALPEPLRSQMLHGDFTAGMEDNAWQVIPTAWVDAAMDRWKPFDEQEPGPMTAMGVDPSRGGRDESIVSRRHDDWFDELEVFEGQTIPDGPTLGAEILRVRRDGCPVHVDAIGIGASVVDWLTHQHVQVVPVTGSEKSEDTDETGTFKFRNARTAAWWMLRETLDPKNRSPIALPRDSKLRADLTAPTYKILEGNVIALEKKEDMKKRLGRSPDRGDAVVYASMYTPVRDPVIMNQHVQRHLGSARYRKRPRVRPAIGG